MAAQVIPFSFDAHPVRTLLINDQPWFVAGDVAAALNYRMASDMTRNLDDDEKGTQIVRTPPEKGAQIVGTPCGDQEMTVINESGLYSAILRSRKPEAKRFKKWVTAEVLPAIRKHGHYSDDNGKMETLSGQAIGASGFRCLGAVLDGKVSHLQPPVRKSVKQHVWSQVRRAFSVTSVQDIPADQLDSARNFVAAYAIEGEFIEAGKPAPGITLAPADEMKLYILLAHYREATRDLNNLYVAYQALESKPLLRVWDHLHEGKPSYLGLVNSLGSALEASYLHQIGEVGRRHLHS